MTMVGPHDDRRVLATPFDRELNRVIDAIRRGELADAATYARDVERRAKECGDDLAVGRALTFLAEVSLLEGTTRSARESATEAVRLLAGVPLWGGVARAHRLLAEIARAEGNGADLWRHVTDAEEAAASIPRTDADGDVRARAYFECHVLAASLLCDENRVEEGMARLRDADLLAVELTDPMLLGDLALVRGRLEWLLDAKRGLELMRKAERTFAANRLTLKNAAALEAQGDCLLSAGDLVGARAAYARALALCADTSATGRTARLSATLSGLDDRLRAARSLDDSGTWTRASFRACETPQPDEAAPANALLSLLEAPSFQGFCDRLVASIVREHGLSVCAAVVQDLGNGSKAVIASEPAGLTVEGLGALVDREAGRHTLRISDAARLTLEVRAPQSGRGGALLELLRRIASLRVTGDVIAELRRGSAQSWSETLKHGMVAVSLEMQAVLTQVYKAAQSDCTVLVTGESGVGKERVANAIHLLSRRSDGPYSVTNCAAIPLDLVEAKLFGHKKGAFTGATSESLGVFRSASKGTLVLDEIGELPIAVQPKILRALDVHEVEPIGAIAPVSVDTRVIAATNRDLEREVAAGRFRLDLFHRLNVVTIAVPPLRSRPADITPLARYFVDKICEENRVERHVELAPTAERALREYRWPGNVRELYNVLFRTLLLNDYRTVEADHVAPWTRESKPNTGTLVLRRASRSFDDVMNDVARQALVGALRDSSGSRAEACRKLALTRSRFYRVARQVGLDLSHEDS
jgi:DNA-binding NtrC family response regulator